MQTEEVLETEFARSTTIPHVEARRSSQENSCYRPHTHDTFSIGLIDSGTSVFAGPLGGNVHLRPGDVIVIAADQVHQCNPYGGRWVYQMIHMDQGWATDLAPDGSAQALFSSITVLRHPNLHARLSAWNSRIFEDESRERLETDFRMLLRDLSAAAPDHVVTSDADPDLRERLHPVMERLRYDESNPSLDNLAALVGMSRHQLIRSVKRATGLAPLAWRQNARIIEARHMLRDGHALADTAHTLGFTDQSHFHRVFRAHVAAPPGQYRSAT